MSPKAMSPKAMSPGAMSPVATAPRIPECSWGFSAPLTSMAPSGDIAVYACLDGAVTTTIGRPPRPRVASPSPSPDRWPRSAPGESVELLRRPDRPRRAPAGSRALLARRPCPSTHATSRVTARSSCSSRRERARLPCSGSARQQSSVYSMIRAARGPRPRRHPRPRRSGRPQRGSGYPGEMDIGLHQGRGQGRALMPPGAGLPCPPVGLKHSPRLPGDLPQPRAPASR